MNRTENWLYDNFYIFNPHAICIDKNDFILNKYTIEASNHLSYYLNLSYKYVHDLVESYLEVDLNQYIHKVVKDKKLLK